MSTSRMKQVAIYIRSLSDPNFVKRARAKTPKLLDRVNALFDNVGKSIDQFDPDELKQMAVTFERGDVVSRYLAAAQQKAALNGDNPFELLAELGLILSNPTTYEALKKRFPVLESVQPDRVSSIALLVDNTPEAVRTIIAHHRANTRPEQAVNQARRRAQA